MKMQQLGEDKLHELETNYIVSINYEKSAHGFPVVNFVEKQKKWFIWGIKQKIKRFISPIKN